MELRCQLGAFALAFSLAFALAVPLELVSTWSDPILDGSMCKSNTNRRRFCVSHETRNHRDSSQLIATHRNPQLANSIFYQFVNPFD